MSKMVLGSSLSVEIWSTPRKISALLQALVPESKEGSKCPMRILKMGNGVLILRFSSHDLASLRASFNTNLRLLGASLKTIEAVSKLSKFQES